MVMLDPRDMGPRCVRNSQEEGGVKPNAVSFNSVIYAHTQSGNIQAAEALLREMNDLFASSGDADIRPTLETYGNVIYLDGEPQKVRDASGCRSIDKCDRIKLGQS